MFGIGRLNGNNLHLGSIDVTTSQLYTGISFLMWSHDRITCHFSTALFLCESYFHWYVTVDTLIVVLWLVGASCVVVGAHASLFAIDRNPFEPVDSTV
jgi:hypothetical protein